MQTVDKAKYEGYIWMSDSKTPIVYTGQEEVELTLTDGENPFVIEGNLWNAAKHESIKIVYVDGKYRVRKDTVTEAELAGVDDSTPIAGGSSVGKVATTRKEYFAHRLPQVEKLQFVQYWEAKADEMCEGMDVLVPTKLVFVGLKYKEN